MRSLCATILWQLMFTILSVLRESFLAFRLGWGASECRAGVEADWGMSRDVSESRVESSSVRSSRVMLYSRASNGLCTGTEYMSLIRSEWFGRPQSGQNHKLSDWPCSVYALSPRSRQTACVHLSQSSYWSALAPHPCCKQCTGSWLCILLVGQDSIRGHLLGAESGSMQIRQARCWQVVAQWAHRCALGGNGQHWWEVEPGWN